MSLGFGEVLCYAVPVAGFLAGIWTLARMTRRHRGAAVPVEPVPGQEE